MSRYIPVNRGIRPTSAAVGQRVFMIDYEGNHPYGVITTVGEVRCMIQLERPAIPGVDLVWVQNKDLNWVDEEG